MSAEGDRLAKHRLLLIGHRSTYRPVSEMSDAARQLSTGPVEGVNYCKKTSQNANEFRRIRVQGSRDPLNEAGTQVTPWPSGGGDQRRPEGLFTQKNPKQIQKIQKIRKKIQKIRKKSGKKSKKSGKKSKKSGKKSKKSGKNPKNPKNPKNSEKIQKFILKI
jgi:hypothetical protein